MQVGQLKEILDRCPDDARVYMAIDGHDIETEVEISHADVDIDCVSLMSIVTLTGRPLRVKLNPESIRRSLTTLWSSKEDV